MCTDISVRADCERMLDGRVMCWLVAVPFDMPTDLNTSAALLVLSFGFVCLPIVLYDQVLSSPRNECAN